eukprot:12157384-Heterocapsa_arctica.AAC.1
MEKLTLNTSVGESGDRLTRGSHRSSACVSRDPVPGLPPRRIINVCGSRPGAASQDLNTSVGESGDRLTRAANALEQLTGQQPVFSKGKRTIRSFGVR